MFILRHTLVSFKDSKKDMDFDKDNLKSFLFKII